MSEKLIMHIDMNAFFASVEQTANPFIRNKPVGVGGAKSYKNAALLAISYEAKAKGVKKFMRSQEALTVCPDLIIVPFDPLKYYSINKRIMSLLREYTPEVEVYSIDEAFVDVTSLVARRQLPPTEIAQEIKDRIQSEVGSCLRSSVGIAPNKLLAKIASSWEKPDGMTVIPWDQRLEFIDSIPIEDIWGIGHRSAAKLAELGITSAKQVRELDANTFKSIFGSYSSRIKLIVNGEWYDKVNPQRSSQPHKSMQHAHTLSVATNDDQELKSLIRKMSERLASRLRRHAQRAQLVYLGFKPEKQNNYGWGSPTQFQGTTPLSAPSNDGKAIYDAACQLMDDFEIGQTKIRLLAVGVHTLTSSNQALMELFTNQSKESINKAIDEVNKTYGEFTVRSGDILYQYAKETELKVPIEDMTFHPATGHG